MTKCISLRIWPKSEIILVFPRNTGKSFFVEVHFQKVIVLIWSTVQQIHKRLCVTRNENWKNTFQIESPQKTHNFIYKYIWLLFYENPVLMILISTCLKHKPRKLILSRVLYSLYRIGYEINSKSWIAFCNDQVLQFVFIIFGLEYSYSCSGIWIS